MGIKLIKRAEASAAVAMMMMMMMIKCKNDCGRSSSAPALKSRKGWLAG